MKSAFKLLVTLKCWYMWEFSHMEFRCVLSEEGILNKSSINSPLLDWVALHIKHEADFDRQCPLWGCLMPGNFCWVSHAFVYDLSLRDLQDCIFQLFFFIILTLKILLGAHSLLFMTDFSHGFCSPVFEGIFLFSFIWDVQREGCSCRVELLYLPKDLFQLWC